MPKANELNPLAAFRAARQAKMDASDAAKRAAYDFDAASDSLAVAAMDGNGFVSDETGKRFRVTLAVHRIIAAD